MQALGNPVPVKNLGLTERWASIISGLGLLRSGMKKRSAGGALLTVLGGDLIYWGISGYSPVYKALGLRPRKPAPGRNASIPYGEGIRVDKAITVAKPHEEVYAFWRNLENLPKFMRHARNVRQLDGKRSHWMADGPAGTLVEWDAEIINDQPNELIAWRSLPGSELETAGSVHFKPALRGGTELMVELQYLPPAGAVGAKVAKLMGDNPAEQIEEDLRRMKQLMETGEIATTEGQPRGAARDLPRSKESHLPRAARESHDWVGEASEDSFPASDPPSWTTPRKAS